MKKLLLPLLLLLASCSYFIEKMDAQSPTKAPVEKKLSILFSHNLSGETHPCGCRNFPLGGLPQVAGLFADISKNSEIVYVDTGDTFFASSVVPFTMKDSLSFNANNLSVALDQVGLKYFVPGDQDFAMGLNFLQGIANSRKFEFLIANLKDENTFKHKKFAVIERDKSKIFLVGLVEPEVFNGPHANLFEATKTAFPKVMAEVQKAGFNKNNKYHRLIVLSHAGIDMDGELAKEFPYIDWIIGAHSQSFLRYSRDEGNVKMVQALSKNHYVGDIQIDLNSKKETDTYALHEVREELEKKLSPNPMSQFIVDHKTKMNDIQIKEQAAMGMSEELNKQLHKNVKKFTTAQTCISCHKPQGDFWQETPHSIAYTTLINVNEANNLSCIGCHSLGMNDPKGFATQKDMVTFKNKSPKAYWDEVKALGAHHETVRGATKEAIKETSVKWFALDKKHNVKNNFANVQCLNCHSQDDNHPKVVSEITKEDRNTNIKNKCVGCHTPDQTPEWYANGLQMTAKFDEAYKAVSCPGM